jgi:hypothetical protein
MATEQSDKISLDAVDWAELQKAVMYHYYSRDAESMTRMFQQLWKTQASSEPAKNEEVSS